ncbi:MAG TPA: Gfo/Idh/MocA family oxidoreductase [Pirellulales bacterium]|jgi:predicted dehydrogenase|nr:Gfo/Idh/MocA family oxidoreductase [Pirellulales bacterium]
MYLSPEEKAAGQANFQNAIGVTRRDFLKTGIAAGAVSGAGLGAMYFGYEASVGNPLRIGVIGTGDEGNVLLGAITPSFIQVVAISDIRPYNVHRAFHGDHSSENALRVRSGLMQKYGWNSEDEARKHVKVYDQDYHDLLADPAVEAVVIALPLHLHSGVAIEAMKAGKHVLTEKLMGHSVHECKEMARFAQQSGKILATGHQRHYSILYDNAVDTIRRGLIGEIHSIRAQWHRDNMPGHDSWSMPLPDDKMGQRIARLTKELETARGLAIDKLGKEITRLASLRRDIEAARASTVDTISHELDQLTLQYLDHAVKAENFGYQEVTLADGRRRSALEELIRWRLWNRTGGGLMAELGSHQLDAAGIFISGLRSDGEKALPLTVSAVGVRSLFPLDRDCEDHVYCVYEFPGPDYESDPNKKIGVTYSSINGNGFGGYGETVMGTKGTLILEREQEVMLFSNSAPATTSITVSKDKKGAPTLDTTQSGGGEAAAVGKKALEGPVSRGYTEELEHWAWCIRNPDPKNQPRCRPKVALGDAVIALTTNIAIRENRRIEFKKEWFDIDSDETPEGVAPRAV